MNPANPVSACPGDRGRAAASRKSATRIRRCARMLEIGLKLEGPLPPCLDACRGHRHRRPAAGRTGAALSRSALVAAGHSVQHEICREGGPGEVRLPRPQDADRHRQGAEAHSRSASPDFDIATRFRSTTGRPIHMLAQGDTVGVFQLESSGMRDAVRQMRADRFEDLIALVALYRPGPMANIPLYCARKLGQRADRIPASLARADPQGDLRRHHLSGTGAADRQGSWRAIPWREADLLAPRHGQEDQVGDGCAARATSSQARSSAASIATVAIQHLRSLRKVRRIRLQQIALRTLRLYQLPDRLSQGQLSGGIPGRIDVARHGQHRQAAGVPPGSPAHGRQDRAALGQCQRRRFRGKGRRRFSIRWRRSRMWVLAPFSTWSRSARPSGPLCLAWRFRPADRCSCVEQAGTRKPGESGCLRPPQSQPCAGARWRRRHSRHGEPHQRRSRRRSE